MATAMVTRAERATSIISAGGVIELAAGGYVVVDSSGSGRGHVATTDSCDCPDHRFRGRVCKHILAVRKAQGHDYCPVCSAATVCEQYYIGGRGYVWFRECSADRYHHSVPA